jgi:Tfp pilus assembly protein PilO
MNNRLWVIAGALLAVMILALGGLLGVKPQLDAAQASDDDRANVELLNAQHAAELTALKEQSTRLAEFQASVADLRLSVPAVADIESFTGELAALEASTGAEVQTYTAEEPALFVPSESTAAVTPTSVAGTSFVKVGVTIIVKGTRDQTLDFVKGLQSGSRLVLVNDVSVAAEEQGVTTTSLSGLIYFLLDTPFVDPSTEVDPNATPAPTVDATASE